MRIFLDTAHTQDIKKWLETGLVDGVTTNPSLLAKEGPDIKNNLLSICSMVEGDVSIEVVEKDPSAVYRQAREIAQLADNVVVKIPFHQDYLSVIKKLVEEEIRLNITLVFSALQALMVAKLGVYIISPFVGRIDDTGVEGMDLIAEIMDIKNTYDFDTEILAASIRTLHHWKQAALLGADIVTLPPAVLEKAMYHPLTEQGIALFDADWKKLDKKTLL